MARDPAVVWMPGGVRTEIHLTAQDTDGGLCLLIDQPPPGWSLPPHRHRAEAETIHVLEGDFTMTVGGEESTLGPGDTVHVPAGAVHSSSNLGERPGRRLILFSPAGMERFFLETGADRPDTDFDLAAVLASALRHGWDFEGLGDAPGVN